MLLSMYSVQQRHVLEWGAGVEPGKSKSVPLVFVKISLPTQVHMYVQIHGALQISISLARLTAAPKVRGKRR